MSDITNIARAIKYTYGEDVDLINDVVLRDEGSGVEIVKWGILGPAPTIADLEAIVGSQGFREYEKKRESMLIDRETETGINQEIHPVAGIGEQIGILRYALTEIYNRLGEALPNELTHFNDIANAAIQEGQQKKEALNA